MSWEPIPGSHLGATSCRGCGAYVVSIEAERDSAKCIECGRADQSIAWPWFTPIGNHHRSVDYLQRVPAPEPAAEAPYPAPAVTSRQGLTPAPPAAFQTLQGEMRAAGWRTLVQYAHGSMPHSKLGTPLGAKESFALRLEHPDGRHACAVYRGGAWGSLFTWGNGATHHQYPNVTAFRAACLPA